MVTFLGIFSLSWDKMSNKLYKNRKSYLNFSAIKSFIIRGETFHRTHLSNFTVKYTNPNMVSSSISHLTTFSIEAYLRTAFFTLINQSFTKTVKDQSNFIVVKFFARWGVIVTRRFYVKLGKGKKRKYTYLDYAASSRIQLIVGC